jgi:ribosome biogenesis protein Nip4
LIKNTSNILNQAEIKLEIEEIRENDLDKEELNLLLSGNFDFFELKEDRLSIILMKKLDGLNGVAYPNRGVTMVGDYTTRKDYRTLAHEIGHLLGLSHTKEHNYVMTQGKNGYLFSKEEIKTMRKYFNE